MYIASAECDKPLLVPVTFTSTFPADAKVQDRVELPEPLRPVGTSVHAVLLEDRLTKPVKPFRAVTVMLEVAAVPALTVMLTGSALM